MASRELIVGFTEDELRRVERLALAKGLGCLELMKNITDEIPQVIDRRTNQGRNRDSKGVAQG